jgi:hypothetical protein
MIKTVDIHADNATLSENLSVDDSVLHVSKHAPPSGDQRSTKSCARSR